MRLAEISIVCWFALASLFSSRSGVMLLIGVLSAKHIFPAFNRSKELFWGGLVSSYLLCLVGGFVEGWTYSLDISLRSPTAWFLNEVVNVIIAAQITCSFHSLRFYLTRRARYFLMSSMSFMWWHSSRCSIFTLQECSEQVWYSLKWRHVLFIEVAHMIDAMGLGM